MTLAEPQLHEETYELSLLAMVNEQRSMASDIDAPLETLKVVQYIGKAYMWRKEGSSMTWRVLANICYV